MSDGYRLAKMMRDAGKAPQNEIVDLVVGEVTSIEPLKVKIENRELTDDFLIVGALCQETHIKWKNFTIEKHTHTITPWTTDPETAHTHAVQDTFTGGGSSSPTSHSHGIPTKTTESSNTIIPDVLLWRGLKVADKVMMLKLARGQKYFILQREEGID